MLSQTSFRLVGQSPSSSFLGTSRRDKYLEKNRFLHNTDAVKNSKNRIKHNTSSSDFPCCQCKPMNKMFHEASFLQVLLHSTFGAAPDYCSGGSLIHVNKMLPVNYIPFFSESCAAAKHHPFQLSPIFSLVCHGQY